VLAGRQTDGNRHVCDVVVIFRRVHLPGERLEQQLLFDCAMVVALVRVFIRAKLFVTINMCTVCPVHLAVMCAHFLSLSTP
jgi:hypothetical protein